MRLQAALKLYENAGMRLQATLELYERLQLSNMYRAYEKQPRARVRRGKSFRHPSPRMLACSTRPIRVRRKPRGARASGSYKCYKCMGVT